MNEKQLTLRPDCSDDVYLRRMFNWLARINACPKFGSRPIGWYQQHAFSALRFLEAQGGFPVALRHGVICFRPSVGAWQPIATPSQLFDIADARTRS